MRILIVGAGMAGLTAGGLLQQSGQAVTILDKSRAVGGRMASKRMGRARFDTGAQHFSARSDEFGAAVAGWLESGIARVWYEGRSLTHPDRGVEPRHVGVGGMREIPEALAQTLDVRTSQHVERIQLNELVAVSTDDSAFEADLVVLTAPLPQTLAILEAGNIEAPHELENISYDATLAVMATLDGPADLPDGHRAISDGPIAWIADNHHKGVSAVPAVTIHSSAPFAERHLETPFSEWVALLTEAARPHLSAGVLDVTGHRWRYSQPRNPRSDGAMALADGRVVVAGEAFAGAKVEGAFLSGTRAAELVLAQLG